MKLGKITITNLAGEIGYKGFMGNYTYLATPGITGIEMARSNPDKCIYLGNSYEEIAVKLDAKIRTFIKKYYENFWPKILKEDFLGEENNVSKQIYNFFDYVKETMKKD